MQLYQHMYAYENNEKCQVQSLIKNAKIGNLLNRVGSLST